MHKYFLAGVVLALMVSTAHANKVTLKFEDIDTNDDKAISVEEALPIQWLSEKFEEADSNKDAKLDKGEFETIVKSSGM